MGPLVAGVSFALAYGITQRVAAINLGDVIRLSPRFEQKQTPGVTLKEMRQRYGEQPSELRSDLDPQQLEFWRKVQEQADAAAKAKAEAAGADPKGVANWITGDIAAYVNANRLSYSELAFRPEQVAEMVKLIDGGKISGKIAKEILPELLEKGGSPAKIVDERGLGMISDPAAITAIVEELLAAHPEEVEAFRGGKNKLQGFFVGQLMKKTGGKADPKLANQILSQKLKG